MKKITLLVIFSLALSTLANAEVLFFIDDEVGWTSAIGDSNSIEFFETTASNIALANEVGSPPTHTESISSILTFDSKNTLVSPSFVVRSIDAPNFKYYGSLQIISEGLIFTTQIDINDWEITFSGSPVRAFSILLCHSDSASNETFSVYGKNGLLGSTTAIPDGSHSVIFLGIISPEPITRVVFDENDSDGDNIGIADLKFSELPTSSNDISVSVYSDKSEYELGESVLITLDASVDIFHAEGRVTDPNGLAAILNFYQTDPNSFAAEYHIHQCSPMGTYTATASGRTINGQEGYADTTFEIPIQQRLRADINNDKRVNLLDFYIMAEEWLLSIN